MRTSCIVSLLRSLENMPLGSRLLLRQIALHTVPGHGDETIVDILPEDKGVCSFIPKKFLRAVEILRSL